MTSAVPTFVALPCRWMSRPQHQEGSRRQRFAAPFSLPGASAKAIASMCVLPNAPLRSQGAALK